MVELFAGWWWGGLAGVGSGRGLGRALRMQLAILRCITQCDRQPVFLPPGPLRSLPPGRNQLTAVPPELGLLPALRTLELRDNQLTAIPPEVRGLSMKGVCL